MKVLQGGTLDAKDKYSFEFPPILSPNDWENLLNKTWTDAETFASLAEQLTENKMDETFCDEKYGSYYRNLHGIIDHLHFHLMQIVLIKKILLQIEKNNSSPHQPL